MMSSRAAVILSLAFVGPVLSGFAPGAGGVGDTPPGGPMCSIYDTTAYSSDHIAWELGMCWESWSRPANACTHTSVHTFTLDDPSSTIVVAAGDDFQATEGLATTAAQCAARRVTLKVERENPRAPNTWTTIGNYTKYGSWSASDGACYLFMNWTSISIPTATNRVRLTAQAIRHDNTYAGTLTYAGYIYPTGMEPCVDVTP